MFGVEEYPCHHVVIWLLVYEHVGSGVCVCVPLPWTQSLAMPEVVPVSRCVRNLKVCGHVNMVSRFSCMCPADGGLS